MKRFTVLIIVVVYIVLAGCSGKKGPNEISVMTLNIRYDNPEDSVNAWSSRSSIVYDVIRREKPDLLGLQEVLYHQYNYLDSLLTGYESAGVGRDDGGRSGEMNPVFYRKDRFNMVRNVTFWLSDTPEVPGSKAWSSSLPRIVTWTQLVDKKTDEHMFFFNTHFAHDSDTARIMSARLLMSTVDSIAAGFPFVITGDFNVMPGSEAYSLLTGPAESIPLFKDSKDISEENPEGPAYTFNGFSDEPGSIRLDYIFVSNDMRVLQHRTLMKKEQGVFVSDHWPVIAVVTTEQ